jgi:hypothetical protein
MLCGEGWLTFIALPDETGSPVLPGATVVLQGISPTASICSIPTYATQEQSYGTCDGYNPAQFNSVAASALPAPVSTVAVSTSGYAMELWHTPQLQAMKKQSQQEHLSFVKPTVKPFCRTDPLPVPTLPAVLRHPLCPGAVHG